MMISNMDSIFEEIAESFSIEYLPEMAKSLLIEANTACPDEQIQVCELDIDLDSTQTISPPRKKAEIFLDIERLQETCPPY